MTEYAVHWGWSLLPAFSAAFNLLASVQQCAEVDTDLGMALLEVGRDEEAIG